MPYRNSILVTVGALLAVVVPAVAAAPTPAAVDFNRDVRPILADHCFACHGPDERARKAKLRLDVADDAYAPRDNGPAVVPGKPDESSLIARITTADADELMPPPHSKLRLSPAQIDVLRRWVAGGGAYADHWAFLPPVRAMPAAVPDAGWNRSVIDRLVWSKLASAGRTPRPRASPEVLLRRLSLDLTGLPPTPAEADAFLAVHARDADRAIEQAVDRLLASPRYGEHMAWAWLDAARYADTNGYQGDSGRQMWRWKQWLITALNRNLTYDQLTIQMLAGDLLIPADQRQWESGHLFRDETTTDLLLASGFARNIAYDSGSGTIPDESKFENATTRMETVGTVWMGLTLQCARCHDHKFDPISAREYYQLTAFFDQVPEFGSAIPGGNSHPYIVAPLAEQREELAEQDAAVADAETALDAAEPAIAQAQADWERRLTAGGGAETDPAVAVPRGLKHHFRLAGPDATLTGLPNDVTTVDGPVEAGGPAIRFDGQTPLQGSEDPGKLCAESKRWTISLWLRPDHVKDQTLLSIVEKPDTDRKGIQIDIADGRLRLRHVCRWNHSVIEFVSRSPIDSGQWTHVAMTSDGRMQGLAYRAYLDGDPAAFEQTKQVTNDNVGGSGNAPLVVGGGPYLPNYQGALSDLRFYDRLLEQPEVAILADRRPLADVAAIPPGGRSPQDAFRLRQAFLDGPAAAGHRALRQALVDAEADRRAFIAKLPTAMVMQDLPTRRPSYMRTKGAYDKVGDEVQPGVPHILPPLPPGSKVDRLALARSLVSGDHPLTGRVAVNRIWQQLFGRGLVDSPENFGVQCRRPLHAELLDWLATEYVRLGWDTKALIRTIALSQTYQQASDAPAELWAADPENRLLARGPRHRLSIGVIRDQALFAAGLLTEQIGGEPMPFPEPADGPRSNPTPRRGKAVVPKADEPEPRRRTIYAFWKRNAAAPMLAVFDVNDRNLCAVAVKRTNTPLQALVVLNEPGMLEAAAGLARRTLAEGGDSDRDRIAHAFRIVTAARPTAGELATLEAALGEYRQAYAQAPGDDGKLLASSRLIPPPILPGDKQAGDKPGGDKQGGDDRESAVAADASELAAWTTLCNVLLNLDRTLTTE